MSKSRLVQSNFTAGEIAPTLRGRIDIEKYYSGCAQAENVLILPHGGLRRRPGLAKITDSHQTNAVRIEAFEFSVTQDYLIVFEPSAIKIFKDGVLQSTEVSPYTTEAMIKELDFIQSADTMIITHEDVEPQQLQRQGSDTNWALSALPLTNIPVYNFDGHISDYTNDGTSRKIKVETGIIVYNHDGDDDLGLDNHYYQAITTLALRQDLSTEDFLNTSVWTDIGAQDPVWSATKGWPRTCTFHDGRLYFGGSKSKINSVWGSVPNEFFNFDTETGNVDAAVFDTLDTEQFNAINGIFSGRSLQVFTSGGEFYNSSKLITVDDSNWKKQTSYGSDRHRPISVDGSTLYVDRTKRTIRQFVWSFNEDSYISTNVTLMSSHIVNDIQGTASVRGTAYDISDLVYVVNGDGTVAVMNTMRLQEIQGWTKWTTDGLFKDVAVVGDITYFLVERDTEMFIEYLREGTYSDHNVAIFGTSPTIDDIVHSGSSVVHDGEMVVHTDPATGVVITEVDTDYIDLLTTRQFKVTTDGAVQPDDTVTVLGVNDNKMVLPRDAYSAEVGIGFNVIIKTLPLNVGTQSNGDIVNLRKRVSRVILNLHESQGVSVFSEFMGDKVFPVVLDEAADPFTGIKEIYLFGYIDRLVEVEVTQDVPLPLTLLSIDSEIEF